MKLFDVISIAVLLYLSSILSWTFLRAYSSGSILVQINEYGEAPYEAVILIIALSMGVITLIRTFRRLICLGQ